MPDFLFSIPGLQYKPLAPSGGLGEIDKPYEIFVMHSQVLWRASNVSGIGVGVMFTADLMTIRNVICR
jgi:hypothetical protein